MKRIFILLFFLSISTYAQYTHNTITVRVKNYGNQDIYIATLEYWEGVITDELYVRGWHHVKPRDNYRLFKFEEGYPGEIAFAVGVKRDNQIRIINYKPKNTSMINSDNSMNIKARWDKFSYKLSSTAGQKISDSQWAKVKGDFIPFTFVVKNPMAYYDNVNDELTLDFSNITGKERVVGVLKKEVDTKGVFDPGFGSGLKKSNSKKTTAKKKKVKPKLKLVYDSKTKSKRRKVQGKPGCYDYYGIRADITSSSPYKSIYIKDPIFDESLYIIYRQKPSIQHLTSYEIRKLNIRSTSTKKSKDNYINFRLCESDVRELSKNSLWFKIYPLR